MSTKVLLIFLFSSYFLMQSFLFFLFSQSRVSYVPIFLSNHAAGHPVRFRFCFRDSISVSGFHILVPPVQERDIFHAYFFLT